jgi:hypothetical protein
MAAGGGMPRWVWWVAGAVILGGIAVVALR